MDDHEHQGPMKPGDRTFLFFLIAAAWALTAVFVVAAVIWPHGLLDVNGPLAAILGVTLITLIAGLNITFGSMAAENPAIGPGERAIWIASFLLAGPVAFPAYWLMYLWSTPERRRLHAA